MTIQTSNKFLSFFSCWILDSVATDHICSSLTHFTSCHQINLICLKLPNGNQVIVNYSGSVFLNQNHVINNVLYIPCFTFNLLSVTKLIDRLSCDGKARKHFDTVYLDFVADPRHVRLGLCSDGFTPYIQASTSSYSCWPIFVTPYNLLPEMCMTKPMFLTCIIPGPSNPTKKIDVNLQPLINELQQLWNEGVLTYNISSKENFLMRAYLMWTINDFSAYDMLSG